MCCSCANVKWLRKFGINNMNNIGCSNKWLVVTCVKSVVNIKSFHRGVGVQLLLGGGTKTPKS